HGAGAGVGRWRSGRRRGARVPSAPVAARARGVGARDEVPRRRGGREARSRAGVAAGRFERVDPGPGRRAVRHDRPLSRGRARLRLAGQALREGLSDSAAGLFRSEIEAGAPQRLSARFWLGRLERLNGDSAAARADWMALAREDSIGYYGLRARRELGMPPLRIAAASLPAPTAAIAAALGRIDTLLLAGLDTAAQAEVRAVLGRAPQLDLDGLLAWSAGLGARGFGPASVRLGWQAALKAPNDPRVLRAIFPWPNRRAVE